MLYLTALLASSCRAGELQAPPGAPATSQASQATPTVSNENTTMTAPALFLDADGIGAPPTKPFIMRSRHVKINSGILLNVQGEPRELPPNAEITLNLFSDTTYTGVIERVEEDGGAVSWVGHLKGAEISDLLIVYNAGLFLGHFARPGGVYEVSSAGGDLYLIIQIDQDKLPGGEGDTKIPTAGP